jgi:hypothetical protein
MHILPLSRMLVTLSEEKLSALQGALSNLLLILGLSSKRSLSSIRYRSTFLRNPSRSEKRNRSNAEDRDHGDQEFEGW